MSYFLAPKVPPSCANADDPMLTRSASPQSTLLSRECSYLLARESLANNLGVLVDQHVLDSLLVSRSLGGGAEHALGDYSWDQMFKGSVSSDAQSNLIVLR